VLTYSYILQSMHARIKGPTFWNHRWADYTAGS